MANALRVSLLCLTILALVSTSASGLSWKQRSGPSRSPSLKESGEQDSELGVVVDVTDDTFDDLLEENPVWMIDVFAQWCSHCRQLEPTWKELAKELATHGIRTGKVEGPQNKVLMTRLGISSFPAIFLLKDGSAWEYDGARTVQALKEFALSGHEKATALPFWKAPNSMLGRVLGHWHRIPSLVREAYKVLREEKGLSDLAIVSFFLAVPVVVGLGSICLLDGLYLRQARMVADLAHEE